MELEIVHGPRAMRADLYRGALPDFACIFLFAYCTLPRDGDFRRCVMRGLHRFAIIRRGSLSLWPFHDFQPQLLFFSLSHSIKHQRRRVVGRMKHRRQWRNGRK